MQKLELRLRPGFSALPWTEKKTTKSILLYLNEYWSHSVVFFSRIFYNISSFFWAKFWTFLKPTTLFFQSICTSRPLKKGPKTGVRGQNPKFKYEAIGRMGPNFLTRGLFFFKFIASKSFLKPTTQKIYFFDFLTPRFSKKKFFWPQKIDLFSML